MLIATTEVSGQRKTTVDKTSKQLATLSESYEQIAKQVIEGRGEALSLLRIAMKSAQPTRSSQK
jgi:hypothetical protein